MIFDLVEQQPQSNLRQHVVKFRRLGVAEDIHDFPFKILYLGKTGVLVGGGGENTWEYTVC